jgi:hypothetical protein
MASRALRSRMGELSDSNMELPSEDRESDLACGQTEGLGNTDEQAETTDPLTQRSSQSKENSDIQLMLAGFMTVMQQSNEKLQDSIKTDFNSVKADINNVRTDFNSVKADITNVRTDISARIMQLEESNAQLRESNTKFQEGLRAELKADYEKLIGKLEQQSNKSNKELSAKLESESRRLTKLVGQVRQETEVELIAVRSQIDVVSSSFETKLAQAHSQAQDKVDRLSSQIITNKAEVEASITQLNRDVDHQLTQQGESLREMNQVLDQEKANTQTRFEQVNAKIASLQTKIADVPSRTVPTTDSRPSSSNPFSPSVVKQDGTASEHIINNVNHGTANENRDGSGQSSVENVCMQNIVRESGMNVTTINP